MRNNPRIWPIILASAIGFVILCTLGAWQLQRLQWKEALLADLDARATAEPASLQSVLDADAAGKDIEFQRVALTARFLPGPEIHVLTTYDGRPGWEVVAPALSEDGIFLLVDRGVVPDELRNDPRRAEQAGVMQPLEGVVRLRRTARSIFSPENDAARNLWHWWDVPAMIAAANPPSGAKVAPFVVQLMPKPDDKSIPRPPALNLGLKNNHLQYALTWFSLAAVLLLMTGVFVRGLLKRTAA